MSSRTGDRLRVGIVGCGSISEAYIRNSRLFQGVELIACADLDPAASRRRAEEFGIVAMDNDTLIASKDIDLILNLTVPSAHFSVTMQALGENKHVFTEKPLSDTAERGRLIVAEAQKRGLTVGSAPDTFMGAAGRFARRTIEDGSIGTPVIGTAFMMSRGMEHWHPDPWFYYQPGGGPVLDMGPYYLTMMVNLMGPITGVQAISTSGQEQRLITAEGPKKGTRFNVGTPTSVLSLLEFSSGTKVTFGASWDVFRYSLPPIEIHGTQGSMRLPDPDNFGGIVGVSREGEAWTETNTAGHLFGACNWPTSKPDRANYRMLGLTDVAQSLIDGRSPRASSALALHVLEVMEAILKADELGRHVSIAAPACQPQPLSDNDAKALLL